MKQSLFVLAAFLAATSGAASCELGHKLDHPSDGAIYERFGYRRHPLLNITRLHPGWDYRVAEGDPIGAAEAGRVVAAGAEGGYGNYIRIDHGNGLQTAYGHLQHIDVKKGSCVSKGQVIGTAGQTGISSGPHLHFEDIRDRRFVDPVNLLPERI